MNKYMIELNKHCIEELIQCLICKGITDNPDATAYADKISDAWDKHKDTESISNIFSDPCLVFTLDEEDIFLFIDAATYHSKANSKDSNTLLSRLKENTKVIEWEEE